MSKHVAVLMGGWSAEREVSLNSGANCAKALEHAGFTVTAIDVQRDMGKLMKALNPAPDVVFNALHGRFGEDGSIQGLLDILNIPYTHSGVLASALAMDKVMAKRLFETVGIRCAHGVISAREDVLAGDVMERPYVIKPINEGSSVGVHIVQSGDHMPPFDGRSWPYGDRVLVERYVPGRELTVGVIGERALAVTEVQPQQGFYDYDAKYDKEKAAVHVVPAPVPKAIYDEAMRLAALAHQTLGCRGCSRADFRYDEAEGGPGAIYILEVNTQPGMTPMSLVPEQAAHIGMSFDDLVVWMVEHAECDA
ncbi:MAG: D-alanine--D-alanine ligase [Alphaproteobacteria bacterium]|nr:D-alanine--D-alanine ligase [Alphaproteobacteria bacterium]